MIELNHVSKSYPGKKALSDVSLRLPQGEIVGLFGENGAGKTTLIKCILGLLPHSGSITLGGTDLRKIPIDMLNDRIAYVSQDNFLFDTTIMENIRLGKTDGTASDEDVINAAKQSGCHEFIMGLEKGYDTVVGSSGGHLSGGERQRIAIARAMLKNADIIILDEATAYTDPENEAVIQESVARLVKGKTLIVIAHRLSTVKDADRIFVIKDGKVDASGTHAELLAEGGLCSRMWQAHISAKDEGGQD